MWFIAYIHNRVKFSEKLVKRNMNFSPSELVDSHILKNPTKVPVNPSPHCPLPLPSVPHLDKIKGEGGGGEGRWVWLGLGGRDGEKMQTTVIE